MSLLSVMDVFDYHFVKLLPLVQYSINLGTVGKVPGNIDRNIEKKLDLVRKHILFLSFGFVCFSGFLKTDS